MNRGGGFVTPRLHVPHEVWTQGGAKLTNAVEKTKVIDLLLSALEELNAASLEFCGAGGAAGLPNSPAPATGRKEAERWATKIEDFDRSFKELVVTFSKKLGVGEGVIAKKSVGVAAWSNKFAKSLDRMTTGKK